MLCGVASWTSWALLPSKWLVRLKIQHPGSWGGLQSGAWIASSCLHRHQEVPLCIAGLGIPEGVWKTKLKGVGLGPNQDLSNLGPNLDALERWGMTDKGRRSVVMKELSVLLHATHKLENELDKLKCGLELDEGEVVRVVRKFPKCIDGGDAACFLKEFSPEAHPVEAIRRAVLRYPEVLGRRKEIEAMCLFFKERLGYSQAQVMVAILRHPKLADAAIEGTVRPKITFLEELGLSKAQILSIVVTYPETLCLSIEADVVPQLQRFSDLALPSEIVRKIMKGSPTLLLRDFEECILDKLDWLHCNLSFRHETALKALVKHPRIFPSSLDTWKETCKFYVDAGMSQKELSNFMKKSPKLLSRKSEGMKEKFDFAREVLKKEPLEILTSIRYFTYSFQDRILFRTALTDRAGKDVTKLSFRELLDPSNTDFEKQFREGEVQEFKEKWDQMTKEDKVDCVKFRIY